MASCTPAATTPTPPWGLALAHWAVGHKDALSGRIRFLIEPAEEGTRGAGAMAAAGVVDDADFFFGSHVGGPCRPGEVGLIRHGYFATTKIDVEFDGVPAHAGGNPELGRSALSAAAAATLQFDGALRATRAATRASPTGRLRELRGEGLLAPRGRSGLDGLGPGGGRGGGEGRPRERARLPRLR